MKHTIELTTEELNLVLAALGELPAKVSIALILNLQAQVKPPKEHDAPST